MFPSFPLGSALKANLRNLTSRLGVAALLLATTALPAGAVTITVTYTDGPSEGFNDATLGAQRKAAFEAAANEWANGLQGTIPVNISASMDPLFIGGGGAVLGQAGPATAARNFTGAPQQDIWYPIALANQVAGQDLAPTQPDIVAQFNSDIDDPTKWPNPWYYGTDAQPGNKVDFYDTVVHEFGHGLGFLSLINEDGSYSNGAPIIFDTFKANGAGTNATLATTMSQSERAALEVSQSLYFKGPNAIAANGGTNPKLYAPSAYEQGSSGSHLDQTTYQSTEHRLMCPYAGAPIHNPGTVTFGIMKDMGWTVGSTGPTPTPTTEPTPTGTPDPNATPTATPTTMPTAQPTATPTSTPVPEPNDLTISITTPANNQVYPVTPTATGKASGSRLARVYLALAPVDSNGLPTGWYNWETDTFTTTPNDILGVVAEGTTNWSRALPLLQNGKYLLLAEASNAKGGNYAQAQSRFTVGPYTGQTVSGKCLSIIANPTFDGTVRKGLAGVTLTLVKNGRNIATTTSGADGTFSFVNVGSGNYTINSSTTRPTQPVTVMDPPSRSFTVNKSPVTISRFALFSIFGTVKAPGLNGNMVAQANATVSLINHNNVVAATRTTDANGRYEFRQQRGATFRIRVEKSGFAFSEQARTLPAFGNPWEPCSRVNFNGTRVGGNRVTDSSHSF